MTDTKKDEEAREETYTLPEERTAATAFVNNLQRKGYKVKRLTTTHVVVRVPVGTGPQEGAGPKKQILND
jgi:hypothetical protein